MLRGKFIALSASIKKLWSSQKNGLIKYSALMAFKNEVDMPFKKRYLISTAGKIVQAVSAKDPPRKQTVQCRVNEGNA